MAIEKNSFKVSRLDSEFSPGSRKSMSSNGGDDEDIPRRSSVVESESDDDCEFDDADSGAGSDDFDLLELGETGVEFCQIGNQTCSIPFELYDLDGLEDILSIEVWNQCLSEEDRLGLTKYLPDMDQETFSITMFELFTGSNFHFGSPVRKLFDMLKGGLCEPRVALYREGWNFIQKRQHYHLLRKHQNTMVSNLCQIRDAWKNCRGYSIDERLRVLNIFKSQKSLMREKAGGPETESSERDSDELLRNFGAKDRRIAPLKQNNPRGTLKRGEYRSSKAMMGYEPRVEEDYGISEGRKHKNHLLPRGTGGGHESGLHSYGKRRDVNSLLSEAKVYSTKPPNMKPPYEFEQFPAVEQTKPVKGRNRFDSFWNSRGQDEAFTVDSPFRSDDWSVRGKKKWKPGRDSPELNFKSFAVPSEYRANPLEEDNFRGPSKVSIRGNHFLNNNNNEETESESSADQSYDDEDGNPLLRSKIAYPGGAAEASQSSLKKSGFDKKSKLVKKDTQRALDGITYSAKTIHGIENYSLKAKQKGKMKDISPLNNKSPARVLVESYLAGPVNLPDDENDRIFNFVNNGHISAEPSESLHIPSTKASPADGKKKKGNTRNNAVEQVLDHYLDGGDELIPVPVAANVKKHGRFKKRGQKFEVLVNDHFERSEAPLMGCSSVSKKRKGKADLIDMTNKGDEDNDPILNQLKPIENNNSSSMKKSKKRVEAGSLDAGACELPFLEVGPVDMVPETKPQKKPFTLITPTVHTGFSFSIIHLLSAVRSAMTMPLPEDSIEAGKDLDEQSKKHDVSENGVTLPSLTVMEIVNRVRLNPGDPFILETQEPLQDLVRGVLKIFSSKTAPLGAKGWKALAAYERSTKGWSWLGPISQNHYSLDEVTSPEAWSLPQKTMVKLVDSFASWLKSGQETLQQIGSLPSPPLSLMQPVPDEKERFRDLRAQKSLNTINQSSDEVRAYFRKEEVLRYLIPDRAFSYTAADGKKSIVAPLRRCGGKPTSKARDHFMLKRDRPPHVTILCLVRDAAARLPGSIGTRADVCTLIRDSQYIVEEVPDAQVNQVVSGALDRLHYERDPCVQFDGERKLWVYLHREREEEDFEDDGTSSTKKWKRQKKDPSEQEDQPMVTVAFHGNSDHPGFDLSSDLNAEPSGADDKVGELPFDESGQVGNDDITDPIHGVEHSQEPPPMGWDGIDLNPIRDNNKSMCVENSANEDFDDEAFGRERPVRLLSASLLRGYNSRS